MLSLDLVGPRAFPIRTACVLGQIEDRELHRHGNVELVLVTSGAGEHDTGSGRYQLQRGDVFVIPIGMAHRYVATEQLHLWNIGYDPRRLELPHARLARLPGYRVLVDLEPRLRDRQGFAGHLRLIGPELAWLLGAITDLAHELQSRAAGWQEAATAHLQGILLRLARAYAAQDTPQARAALRLDAVLVHIDRHLGGDLPLNRLADIGGMSTSTLQRMFRSLVGTSVAQHLIARRLEVSRRLLADGMPVANAARAVGIDDPGYFARTFRRQVGVTPSAYRAAQYPGG